MSRLLVYFALAVIAVDSGWDVTISAHPENRAVGVTIQCRGFFAVNRRDIEAGQQMSRAWFPRPAGMPDDCGVTAWVVRWVDEDPSREYVAEQVSIP